MTERLDPNVDAASCRWTSGAQKFLTPGTAVRTQAGSVAASQTVPAVVHACPSGDVRIWIAPLATLASPVENTYQGLPAAPATIAGSWARRSPESSSAVAAVPAEP